MSTTFWIQLLGVIFGLAMLYFTFVKYKRNELTIKEIAVMNGMWIMLVIIALVPSFLDFIIKPLNFYRRLDFFVVVGFFALLSISFYTYTLVRKLQKKLEVIVRREAILDVKNERNKESESEK